MGGYRRGQLVPVLQWWGMSMLAPARRGARAGRAWPRPGWLADEGQRAVRGAGWGMSLSSTSRTKGAAAVVVAEVVEVAVLSGAAVAGDR